MKTGIPYYIWGKGGVLLHFDVVMETGEIIRAYLDPSNQYSADGPTWRRVDNNDWIPRFRILGYNEVEEQ